MPDSNILKRFPLDMTMRAPVTERQSPMIFRPFRRSLKKTTEQRLMKIGLQAMIKEARLALIWWIPEKKNRLYEKMPVNPRAMMIISLPKEIAGRRPSIFNVKKMRKNEAIKNLKKAAE